MTTLTWGLDSSMAISQLPSCTFPTLEYWRVKLAGNGWSTAAPVQDDRRS
jgi:hypothetical protein